VGELVGAGPQLPVPDFPAEEESPHPVRELIGGVIQELGEKKVGAFQALGNMGIIKFQPRFFHFFLKF
jgi:hypothetical protein